MTAAWDLSFVIQNWLMQPIGKAVCDNVLEFLLEAILFFWQGLSLHVLNTRALHSGYTLKSIRVIWARYDLNEVGWLSSFA